MEFKLLDTGYVSADIALTSQDQLDGLYRAGVYDISPEVTYAMDLPNVISSSFGGQNNINSNPQIGTGDVTATGINSIENESITLTFSYNRDNPPFPTSGRTFLKSYAWQLNQMKYTNGVKLLYPSGTGYMETALTHIGDYYTGGIFSSATPDEDDGTVSSTTPYIPVKVTYVKFSDVPTSKHIKVTITCVRTK